MVPMVLTRSLGQAGIPYFGRHVMTDALLTRDLPREMTRALAAHRGNSPALRGLTPKAEAGRKRPATTPAAAPASKSPRLTPGLSPAVAAAAPPSSTRSRRPTPSSSPSPALFARESDLRNQPVPEVSPHSASAATMTRVTEPALQDGAFDPASACEPQPGVPGPRFKSFFSCYRAGQLVVRTGDHVEASSLVAGGASGPRPVVLRVVAMWEDRAAQRRRMARCQRLLHPEETIFCPMGPRDLFQSSAELDIALSTVQGTCQVLYDPAPNPRLDRAAYQCRFAYDDQEISLRPI